MNRKIIRQRSAAVDSNVTYPDRHDVPPFPAPAQGQTGMALVLTLWLLTLLTVMVGGFSYAMRNETRLTVHGVELAKARSRAEAGVWLAVSDLLSPQSERRWPSDGAPALADFGEGTISLRIQDEAGRIDLNRASDELLRGLLEAASQPGDDVTLPLNAILDWRDQDKDRRDPGAEDNDYPHDGYGAKDGPFNSIGELRRVAGITDEIYGNIDHAVTIHSLQPGINPDLAPRIVLQAIPGSDDVRIDEFLANRHKPGEDATITDVDHHYFNAEQGLTFTITSEGTAGRSKLILEVVVSLDEDVHPPYSVLSWRESRLHYNSM